MRTNLKKFMVFVLSLAMVITAVPMTAFAVPADPLDPEYLIESDPSLLLPERYYSLSASTPSERTMGVLGAEFVSGSVSDHTIFHNDDTYAYLKVTNSATPNIRMSNFGFSSDVYYSTYYDYDWHLSYDPGIYITGVAITDTVKLTLEGANIIDSAQGLAVPCNLVIDGSGFLDTSALYVEGDLTINGGYIDISSIHVVGKLTVNNGYISANTITAKDYEQNSGVVKVYDDTWYSDTPNNDHFNTVLFNVETLAMHGGLLDVKSKQVFKYTHSSQDVFAIEITTTAGYSLNMDGGVITVNTTIEGKTDSENQFTAYGISATNPMNITGGLLKANANVDDKRTAALEPKFAIYGTITESGLRYKDGNEDAKALTSSKEFHDKLSQIIVAADYIDHKEGLADEVYSAYITDDITAVCETLGGVLIDLTSDGYTQEYINNIDGTVVVYDDVAVDEDGLAGSGLVYVNGNMTIAGDISENVTVVVNGILTIAGDDVQIDGRVFALKSAEIYGNVSLNEGAQFTTFNTEYEAHDGSRVPYALIVGEDTDFVVAGNASAIGMIGVFLADNAHIVAGETYDTITLDVADSLFTAFGFEYAVDATFRYRGVPLHGEYGHAIAMFDKVYGDSIFINDNMVDSIYTAAGILSECTLDLGYDDFLAVAEDRSDLEMHYTSSINGMANAWTNLCDDAWFEAYGYYDSPYDEFAEYYMLNERGMTLNYVDTGIDATRVFNNGIDWYGNEDTLGDWFVRTEGFGYGYYMDGPGSEFYATDAYKSVRFELGKYPVWVGGTQVTAENASDIKGVGVGTPMAIYQQATSTTPATLYLEDDFELNEYNSPNPSRSNNYHYQRLNQYAGIETHEDLNIVYGTNVDIDIASSGVSSWLDNCVNMNEYAIFGLYNLSIIGETEDSSIYLRSDAAKGSSDMYRTVSAALASRGDMYIGQGTVNAVGGDVYGHAFSAGILCGTRLDDISAASQYLWDAEIDDLDDLNLFTEDLFFDNGEPFTFSLLFSQKDNARLTVSGASIVAESGRLTNTYNKAYGILADNALFISADVKTTSKAGDDGADSGILVNQVFETKDSTITANGERFGVRVLGNINDYRNIYADATGLVFNYDKVFALDNTKVTAVGGNAIRVDYGQMYVTNDSYINARSTGSNGIVLKNGDLIVTSGSAIDTKVGVVGVFEDIESDAILSGISAQGTIHPIAMEKYMLDMNLEDLGDLGEMFWMLGFGSSSSPAGRIIIDESEVNVDVINSNSEESMFSVAEGLLEGPGLLGELDSLFNGCDLNAGMISNGLIVNDSVVNINQNEKFDGNQLIPSKFGVHSLAVYTEGETEININAKSEGLVELIGSHGDGNYMLVSNGVPSGGPMMEFFYMVKLLCVNCTDYLPVFILEMEEMEESESPFDTLVYEGKQVINVTAENVAIHAIDFVVDVRDGEDDAIVVNAVSSGVAIQAEEEMVTCGHYAMVNAVSNDVAISAGAVCMLDGYIYASGSTAAMEFTEIPVESPSPSYSLQLYPGYKLIRTSTAAGVEAGDASMSQYILPREYLSTEDKLFVPHMANADILAWTFAYANCLPECAKTVELYYPSSVLVDTSHDVHQLFENAYITDTELDMPLRDKVEIYNEGTEKWVVSEATPHDLVELMLNHIDFEFVTPVAIDMDKWFTYTDGKEFGTESDRKTFGNFDDIDYYSCAWKTDKGYDTVFVGENGSIASSSALHDNELIAVFWENQFGNYVITRPLDFTLDFTDGIYDDILSYGGIKLNDNEIIFNNVTIDLSHFNGDCADAVKLPENAELVLIGDNTVLSNYGVELGEIGIYSSHDIVITGPGTLFVQAPIGIYAGSWELDSMKDITLNNDGKVEIQSSSPALHGKDIKVLGKGNITAVMEGEGFTLDFWKEAAILAEHDFVASGTGIINATGVDYGIYVGNEYRYNNGSINAKGNVKAVSTAAFDGGLAQEPVTIMGATTGAVANLDYHWCNEDDTLYEDFLLTETPCNPDTVAKLLSFNKVYLTGITVSDGSDAKLDLSTGNAQTTVTLTTSVVPTNAPQSVYWRLSSNAETAITLSDITATTVKVNVPANVVDSTTTYYVYADTVGVAEDGTHKTATYTITVTKPSTGGGGSYGGGGGGGSAAPVKPEPTKVETVWKDVDTERYYYDALQWAFENDIIEPESANKFGIGNDITRAELFNALYKAAGSPKVSATATIPFTDVAKNSKYYNAVVWAYTTGLTNGAGAADVFAPNMELDRAQIVTILWRYSGSKVQEGKIEFTDVEAGRYYEKAVDWSTANGIINGTGDGTTFSPEELMLKESAITMLYRKFVKALF